MSFEHPPLLPSRRRLLQSILAGTLVGAVPLSVARRSLGAQASLTRSPKLVVVELVGGNDGLNTFGRFGDAVYQNARRELAISPADAVALDGEVMAHPSITGIASRYQQGQVALVESVGDSLNDRSHFSNIARWRSGLDGSGVSGTGWLGRYIDRHADGLSAVSVDRARLHHQLRGERELSLALPPNLAAIRVDRSTVAQRASAGAFDMLASSSSGSPLVQEQMSNARLAFAESSRFDSLNGASLPQSPIERSFALAGAILDFDLGIDIATLQVGQFDTHSDQIGDSALTGIHADLLGQVSTGVDLLFAKLSPKTRAETVVLVYSEFGRRVAANNSRGTDHGTANTVMLIGDAVRGGLYGVPPSLTDLDGRGDLKPRVQFQQVYASVLEQHFGVDAGPVLRGQVAAVPNLIGEPPSPTLEERANRIRGFGELDPVESLRRRSPDFEE